MSLLVAFSGQGMQHGQMFKLLAADEWGKHWLNEASELLHLDLFSPDVVQQCCNDVIYAQCLIVTLSAGAFYAINQQINLKPDLLCGYSLGEFTAFGVSAHLSLNDLCSITNKRASLMQEAANELSGNKACGLAVLKGNVNLQLVQPLIATYNCHIAIINAEDHYIIGGLLSDLTSMLAEAKLKGVIKAEPLAVNLPSHTPMLARATGEFSSYLQCISHFSMNYPILNALTNEVIYNTIDMLPILANELSQTLHWNRILHLAPEYGISFFLELGPGRSLKNMFVAENPKIKAYSLDDFSSISGIAQFIEKF